MSQTNNNASDPRRALPSVDALLGDENVRVLIDEYSREVVLELARDLLDGIRGTLEPGDVTPSVDEIVVSLRLQLETLELDRLRPVVNATGIILHTGLGRAVLPQAAVDSLSGHNRCCNLQIDLESGNRGKRNDMTEQLLRRITGAEDALVVNNNAAATLLVLAALSADKEVIISRGQLIEIGGSFRLPDCISQSGAVMVEVGTTNKTHLRDYENALTENTGMILRVNPSNYRIIGFSKQVAIDELVTLKKKQSLVVVDDLGCGALVDLTEYGLPHECTVQESISAGADIAMFSGDKLISGPQAGIIVGKKELIAKIRKHPLNRMLRVCKLTDIALEQTLRLFLDPETLAENHPTLRMMTASVESLKKRADSLKMRLNTEVPAFDIEVVPCESETGGGTMPGMTIPSLALAVCSRSVGPDKLSVLLRKGTTPVIARIADGRVLLDMRTLLDGDDDLICNALDYISQALEGK